MREASSWQDYVSKEEERQRREVAEEKVEGGGGELIDLAS